jgi:two-component system response regulator CpxR
MHRILIVDDDTAFAEMVREFLELEGFAVDTVSEGISAAASTVEKFDLIVLDVMLPGLSGFEVLRRIRQKSDLPVIMLTARGEDIDRILGLETGADDYVSKPVNPRELLARIAPQGPANEIAVGDVRVNPASRDAWLRSAKMDLTSAEFNLLECFLRAAGRVLSRDELSIAAFGRQPYGHAVDRNVDTLVSKLRRKLAPNGCVDERIKTVRNAGYIYAVPATHDEASGDIVAPSNAQ